MSQQHIVALSGGKDSSAMLVRMLELIQLWKRPDSTISSVKVIGEAV